jgi:hypothetical protein
VLAGKGEHKGDRGDELESNVVGGLDEGGCEGLIREDQLDELDGRWLENGDDRLKNQLEFVGVDRE